MLSITTGGVRTNKHFFVGKLTTRQNGLSCIAVKINNNTLKFLVDSGASVSLIKSCFIPKGTIGWKSEIILHGVNGRINNRGCVNLEIEIEKVRVAQQFVVVDEIVCDVAGIIGIDFLKREGAVIDFAEQWIKIREESCQIPMQGVNVVSTIIPRRCERIVEVEVDCVGDVVVLPRQVAAGVFVGGMIVREKDGKIPVRIMNVNECDVKLNNYRPSVASIDEYDCVGFENDKNRYNAKRVEEVLDSVDLKHLNDDERLTIQKVLAQYNDVFHLPQDKLSVTGLFQQTISVPEGSNPTYIKPYRLPHSQKVEINKQVDQMVKDGVVEEASSAWNSPLLLVPKKEDQNGNKKWRLVIDYRQVNKVIEDDKFPLPNITEILDSLSGAVYFSHLDLSQGYYQLELEKNSRKITAFTTPAGQFQMTRLPMGLKISPSAFSRMMTVAMSGLNFTNCFIYLDDLIVFGRNLGEHSYNLKLVLNKLREVNLKLNVGKCQFLKRSLVYLGHTISEKGIEPDKSKVEVIHNFPTPVNQDEVKRFVAMANYYRRHIRNFALIARPLNLLTRKGVEFKWSSKCQDSFNSLKMSLASAEVLDFPDFSDKNEFVLHTDASGTAVGSLLSNSNKRPVAFASRGLSKGELNYSTIEKELLAIVWAVKHFRPYLFGRKFTIVTDHRPLIYLFSLINPSSRLIKFRLALEEYNFEVVYLKGKHNVVADALSRINIDELRSLADNEEQVNMVTTRGMARRERINGAGEESNSTVPIELLRPPKDIKWWMKVEEDELINNGISLKNCEGCEKFIQVNIRTQADIDSIVQDFNTLTEAFGIQEMVVLKSRVAVELVKSFQNAHQNSLIKFVFVNGATVVMDQKQKKVILNDFHHLMTGGHAGIKRMYRNIKQRFSWPGLKKDVEEYVSKCLSCKKCKIIRHIKAPMEMTSTAGEAFQKVYLDLVGPLPMDDSGYKYILTIQCELTKFVEAYPIKNKEAETVADKFVKEFILRFGVPRVIATDCGTEFTAQLFTETCKLLEIEKLLSTPYHHESIGALENSHKQLGQYLKIKTLEKGGYWSSWVPFWTFTHNNSVHSSTNYAPAELVFGKLTTLPSNLSNTIDPIYNFDSYVSELKYRIQVAWKDAKENLTKAKGNIKNRFDKKVFCKDEWKVGEKILLLNHARKDKLEKYYNGPFVITKLDLPNIYINYNGKEKKVHINNVKSV